MQPPDRFAPPPPRAIDEEEEVFPDLSTLYIDDPPAPSPYAPNSHGKFKARRPEEQTVARVAGRAHVPINDLIRDNWAAYKLASAAGTLPPGAPPASMFIRTGKIESLHPKIVAVAKLLKLSVSRTVQLILQVGERGFDGAPFIISMRKMSREFWEKQGIDCVFAFQSKKQGINVQGMLSLTMPKETFSRIHREMMKPNMDPAFKSFYDRAMVSIKKARESGRLRFSWEKRGERGTLPVYKDPPPPRNRETSAGSARTRTVSIFIQTNNIVLTIAIYFWLHR